MQACKYFSSLNCKHSMIWPIRKWYKNMVIWMGTNKIKSTGSPTIFCFPRLHSTCFAHRFSYSSAIHGSLFTGYVICRLDREKGILALVVTIISCPPFLDQICQVYYTRTSIIQTIKISNHRKITWTLMWSSLLLLLSFQRTITHNNSKNALSSVE